MRSCRSRVATTAGSATPSPAVTSRLVKAAAAQLPAVDLATALEITLLIASEEPHNAERAAVRWLGRWALESRQATLDRAEGWPRHLSGVYRSDRADRS